MKVRDNGTVVWCGGGVALWFAGEVVVCCVLCLFARFLALHTDDDHSFSQLPVHKALTCPEGQSAWAWPLPGWRKKFAKCKKNN